MKIFEEYIMAFMQVFLDDFVVYNRKEEHLDHLKMCLEKCWASRLSLNPTKFVFGITIRALLGHIVSKDRIVADVDKVKAILQAPMPTNAKALIRWHSYMLRYLVDFATPLHAVVH